MEIYNKAIEEGKTETEAAAIAMDEMLKALKDDALSIAVEKIQDLASALDKAGALNDNDSLGTMNIDDYNNKIQGIASALSEAFGYDINADWVVKHKNLVKDVLSGDINTIKSAAY